jgi:MFS family permease
MPVTTLDEIASTLSITSDVKYQMVFSIFVLGNFSGPQVAKPLSQRFGRWRISLAFISLFAVSNIACGFARSANQLLCFRLLSGIAGSGQFAIGGANIVDFFGNLDRRSTALVIYSSSFPFGLGIGPLIGAWITERLSWAWSFWVVSASSCLGLLLILVCGTESNVEYISRNRSATLQKSSGSSVHGFARNAFRTWAS